MELFFQHSIPTPSPSKEGNRHGYAFEKTTPFFINPFKMGISTNDRKFQIKLNKQEQ